MFEYLKGKLAQVEPGKAIVDLNGLGYLLLVPLNSFSKMPAIGSEVFFYLALIIREDAHTLFGFLTRNERELFNRLINVSGIGPKTALALVGHMDAGDLQIAITKGNIALLCKVPGIGKKTAERLIVDLRDALSKEPLVPMQGIQTVNSDALNALIHLGYHPLQAQKAIQNVIKSTSEDLNLPELITQALKAMHVG